MIPLPFSDHLATNNPCKIGTVNRIGHLSVVARTEMCSQCFVVCFVDDASFSYLDSHLLSSCLLRHHWCYDFALASLSMKCRNLNSAIATNAIVASLLRYEGILVRHIYSNHESFPICHLECAQLLHSLQLFLPRIWLNIYIP